MLMHHTAFCFQQQQQCSIEPVCDARHEIRRNAIPLFKMFETNFGCTLIELKLEARTISTTFNDGLHCNL